MKSLKDVRARVLNVDDNDGARYVKTRLLTHAGFEVLEAASGGEALELARERQPELVLLDVKLPDINGLEVCRLIKQGAATQHILVLQTSASMVDSAHRVRALDAGADSYLVEPIEPEELVANVRALLRLRRAEDAYRRAKSALGESEERFSQLAESITDVFWVLDLQAEVPRFLYVSPAYGQVWRFDTMTLLHEPGRWFAVMHPDDQTRMRARWQPPFGAGYEEEYRVMSSDGEMRWVAERAFPVSDAAGNVYRLAGVSQDITARKRAELLLKEADRHKNEFLAMLSHELRNPLAPIRNAVDVLYNAPQPLDASRSKAVSIIGRQVEHMARLVNDLLDVSRISQGKIALATEPVLLDSIVASAIETAAPLIEAKRHRVVVELPAPPVVLQADGVRLAQVFANLLHNAAKFTSASGCIRVEAVLQPDQVQVSIADNGIGIAPEVLPSVFDLFTQADQTLDRAQGGLGIGLSLVKTIVRLHGGEARAESAGPGQGSRFTLTLPVAAGAPAPALPSALPGAPRLLRVLVVDDNVDSVETMALLLESQGHEVHTAVDGPTAIDRAAELQPDVVLLDIGLPGMSGYEVARALRRQPHPQAMTLVAISGYGRDSDREAAHAAGFDHHLVKPADPERIFEIMAAV
jgi:PAS domain S-box-containing protein